VRITVKEGRGSPAPCERGKKLTKKERKSEKQKSREITQPKTQTNKERRRKEARELVEVRNGKAERKEGGKIEKRSEDE